MGEQKGSIMRLIDKKGRLFGVINIFDAFVLAILISSALFAFKWMRSAEDPSWAKVDLSHTYCIGTMQMPSYVADLVKDGDEAINEDGAIVAKIEKVLDNKPTAVAIYTSNNGDKMYFDSENRDVTVEVKLVSYKRKGGIYACASNLPITIGTNLNLVTKKYSNPLVIRKILTSGD